MDTVVPRQAVAVMHSPRAAAVLLPQAVATATSFLLLADEALRFIVQVRLGALAGLQVEAETVRGCCFSFHPDDSRGGGSGGGCMLGAQVRSGCLALTNRQAQECTCKTCRHRDAVIMHVSDRSKECADGRADHSK